VISVYYCAFVANKCNMPELEKLFEKLLDPKRQMSIITIF